MPAPPDHKKNSRTALLLLALILAMTGLAFASVPIYRIFCQRTGYGGTPQIAVAGADRIIDRKIKITFTANVNRDLPWEFTPLQRSVTLKAGELGLAFYRATNKTSRPLIGIASYNVTPDKAGMYFNKVACFCFLDQRLDPHQAMDMPVQFFIDPDIDTDPNLADVKEITLSYTFFEAKNFPG